MSSAAIILWCIAGVLLFFSWRAGPETVQKGLKLTWKTTRSNAILILLAFIIVGFVNVLSPEELISTWIGPNSGWQGIATSEFLGMLLPGGPYVVFPIIDILYQAGAGLAPVITLITSWSTLSLLTISFELPFMGWRFTSIRWGIGLLVPLLTGFLALLFWG
jgi:uncharacterized membrane protein YraQ (UPF0718 family)